MNSEDRDRSVEDAAGSKPQDDADKAGLTPEDEQILLKRLRELGYVE